MNGRTFYLNITPVDVLFFRGNELFGPGQHAESLMPPWPSVFAGALRTQFMSNSSLDYTTDEHKKSLKRLIRITFVGLLYKNQIYVPIPSDLVVFKENAGNLSLKKMQLQDSSKIIGLTSFPPLPKLPTLQDVSKPSTNYWISLNGLTCYLNGGTPQIGELIDISLLWTYQPKLGIALDSSKRSAKEQMIYTSTQICLRDGVSFLIGVYVPEDSPYQVHDNSIIKLGGDGRPAVVRNYDGNSPVNAISNKIAEAIEKNKCIKLIFSTPGLSDRGWLPPSINRDGDKYIANLCGVEMRLVSACVGRPKVVSGFDLAKTPPIPKPAMRAIPTGSVYWFEIENGKENIQKLCNTLQTEGIWHVHRGQLLEDSLYGPRWAEGFNNVFIGIW